MKNIWLCQLEAEQAGFKNEKKNWKQHMNTAYQFMMHREYYLVGDRTLPSSLQKNYKNCLK